MKKQFTLNLGAVEIDYVATNEPIDGIDPILVIDKDLDNQETNTDKLHHVSVLLAVPLEVRAAATIEQPLIYIYNGKDLTDGLNDKVISI